MSKQPELVPFTNALGVTVMIYAQNAPAVEEAEYEPPIDHTRWVYAIGAGLVAAAGMALPFLLMLN